MGPPTPGQESNLSPRHSSHVRGEMQKKFRAMILILCVSVGQQAMHSARGHPHTSRFEHCSNPGSPHSCCRPVLLLRGSFVFTESNTGAALARLPCMRWWAIGGLQMAVGTSWCCGSIASHHCSHCCGPHQRFVSCCPRAARRVKRPVPAPAPLNDHCCESCTNLSSSSGSAGALFSAHSSAAKLAQGQVQQYT